MLKKKQKKQLNKLNKQHQLELLQLEQKHLKVNQNKEGETESEEDFETETETEEEEYFETETEEEVSEDIIVIKKAKKHLSKYRNLFNFKIYFGSNGLILKNEFLFILFKFSSLIIKNIIYLNNLFC